jgi:hypothetical protein
VPPEARTAATFEISPLEGTPILSEFYQLRRTAIKDVAAYLGFLAGFIGSAPFAWGLLGEQLASGSFVKGLWYFFGIVVAGGIFAGIAGLGIGYVAGLIWEQIHRHRRRERLMKNALNEASGSVGPAVPRPVRHDPQPPKLHLMTPASAPLPDLAGTRLHAVRFLEDRAELDFGSARVDLRAGATVGCGAQRNRFPEPGSRDALCALFGARVERIRAIGGEKVAIACDNGCEIVLARNATLVA